MQMTSYMVVHSLTTKANIQDYLSFLLSGGEFALDSKLACLNLTRSSLQYFEVP